MSRTAKVVALVAATAVIISVVTVRVIDSTRSDTGAAAVQTVPMVGDNGITVGQVDVVDNGPARSLALTVDYALADGAYRVVLAPDRTAREVLGTMTVRDGRGAWAGIASTGGRPADLELVDDEGAVPGGGADGHRPILGSAGGGAPGASQRGAEAAPGSSCCLYTACASASRRSLGSAPTRATPTPGSTQ